jgi:hypothetical protein
MGEPILRLDAFVPERARIQIDSDLHPRGKMYELRRRSELSLQQMETIRRRAIQALEIESKREDDVTSADMDLLLMFQNELLEIAFYTKLEPEVLKGLDLVQRSSIIQAFNETCFGVAERQEKATPKPRKKKPRTKKSQTGA